MNLKRLKLRNCILMLPLLIVGSANAQVQPEKSAAEIEAYDRSLGQDYAQQIREMYSGAAPAAANLVTPASLAADADLVVEGQVKRVSYTHEGPYEQPFTVNEIEVTRVLKGSLAEEVVVIKQPGGPSKNGELINIVSTR